MRKTLPGIVHEGKLELSDEVKLPEGTRVLVMPLPDDESDFWMVVSQRSLVARSAGRLVPADAQLLDQSLRTWLQL